MQIILFQPQIPQNTGNIIRTCSVTGTSLTLVTPTGFNLSSRQLRRAGMDYFEGVDFQTIDDIEEYLEQTPHPFYFLSSKAEKRYTDVKYGKDDILIFGSETSGLPDSLWQRWPEQFVTIPMKEGSRCLNLATSTGIVLFEALRQQNFSM